MWTRLGSGIARSVFRALSLDVFASYIGCTAHHMQVALVSKSSAKVANSKPDFEGSKPRLLLCDSSPNTTAIALLVGDTGFHVEVARSPEEAAQHCANLAFSSIVVTPSFPIEREKLARLKAAASRPMRCGNVPLACASFSPMMLKVPASLPGRTASPWKLDLSGMRVLYAEDSPVAQRQVKAVLELSGATCTLVDNGFKAVAALAEAPDHFDVVLMDCNMPAMDGWTAARTIRQLEASSGGKRRHIPIIGFTGNTMRGDQRKCLQAGMDDYLSKPASAKAQLATLVKWTTAAHPPDDEEVPFPSPSSTSSLAAFLNSCKQVPNGSGTELERSAGATLPVGSPAEAAEAVASLARQCCSQVVSVDIVIAIDECFGQFSSFCEIFLHFIQDLRPHLARLGAAFRNNDRDMVRHESHSLKGASGSCSAHLAYEMCQHLEQAMKKDTSSDPAKRALDEAVMHALEREVDNLCELGEVLRKHGNKLDFDAGREAHDSTAVYVHKLSTFSKASVDRAEAILKALQAGKKDEAATLLAPLTTEARALYMLDVSAAAQALTAQLAQSSATSSSTLLSTFSRLCAEMLSMAVLSLRIARPPPPDPESDPQAVLVDEPQPQTSVEPQHQHQQVHQVVELSESSDSTSRGSYYGGEAAWGGVPEEDSSSDWTVGAPVWNTMHAPKSAPAPARPAVPQLEPNHSPKQPAASPAPQNMHVAHQPAPAPVTQSAQNSRQPAAPVVAQNAAPHPIIKSSPVPSKAASTVEPQKVRTARHPAPVQSAPPNRQTVAPVIAQSVQAASQPVSIASANNLPPPISVAPEPVVYASPARGLVQTSSAASQTPALAPTVEAVMGLGSASGPHRISLAPSAGVLALPGMVAGKPRFQMTSSWTFLEFLQAQLEPLYRYMCERCHVGVYCQSGFILYALHFLSSMSTASHSVPELSGVEELLTRLAAGAAAAIEAADSSRSSLAGPEVAATSYAALVQELGRLRREHQRQATKLNREHAAQELQTHFSNFFQARLNVLELFDRVGHDAAAFVAALQQGTAEARMQLEVLQMFLSDQAAFAAPHGHYSQYSRFREREREAPYAGQLLLEAANKLCAPPLVQAASALLATLGDGGGDEAAQAVEEELVHLETVGAYAIHTFAMAPRPEAVKRVSLMAPLSPAAHALSPSPPRFGSYKAASSPAGSEAVGPVLTSRAAPFLITQPYAHEDNARAAGRYTSTPPPGFVGFNSLAQPATSPMAMRSDVARVPAAAQFHTPPVSPVMAPNQYFRPL